MSEDTSEQIAPAKRIDYEDLGKGTLKFSMLPVDARAFGGMCTVDCECNVDMHATLTYARGRVIARSIEVMISKLPRWIWIGAGLLALIAGMVNVVGLLSFEHQAVTHLTGTTSLLGAAIVQGNGRGISHLLLVIASFVGGAFLSGCIIRDSTLKLGRHYGIALLLEALLLCAAVVLLRWHMVAGTYMASCACGLQNAMASTYSGAVVRTTHLSGMFTDLGIFLGHAVRGIPVDPRRLRLCALIISGFLCGGIAGAFAFAHIAYDTLLIPAALTGLTAVVYGGYSMRKRSNGHA